MKNPKGCTTREVLFQVYQRLLKKHTEELLALGKRTGFAAAEEQTADLKEQCVAARDELHRHEALHGCMADAAGA